MLLKNKNVVIYGAGGAIGSAASRAFAQEGARVFLAGRTKAKLDAVAKDIAAAGGTAEIAQVDALDEQAIERHADDIVQRAGSLDVSFNVITVPHIQGTPLADLRVDDFTLPVMDSVKTHFLTAGAAARHMVKRKSGVILMMTTTPARRAFPLVGPFGAACAAIEGLSHTLAAELGPHGVRVVCLLSSGSPEAPGFQQATQLHAEAAGKTREEWVRTYEQQTLLRRLTTLNDVTNMAVFLASDRAGAVTGTAVNLSCGAVVD